MEVVVQGDGEGHVGGQVVPGGRYKRTVHRTVLMLIVCIPKVCDGGKAFANPRPALIVREDQPGHRSRLLGSMYDKWPLYRRGLN